MPGKANGKKYIIYMGFTDIFLRCTNKLLFNIMIQPGRFTARKIGRRKTGYCKFERRTKTGSNGATLLHPKFRSNWTTNFCHVHANIKHIEPSMTTTHLNCMPHMSHVNSLSAGKRALWFCSRCLR